MYMLFEEVIVLYKINPKTNLRVTYNVTTSKY